MTGEHEISTGFDRLDFVWVVPAIRASYWGGWQTHAQVIEAMGNSLCFGLYRKRGTWITAQIGFARVLTDQAAISVVTDVIIREGFTHQGYGTALMRAVLDHPQVKPTLCILDCRPENEAFYTKLGFARQRNIMQINPR